MKLYRNPTDNNDQRSSSVSLIQIINVKDDVIRNSFMIKYNLETITMMCDNAHNSKNNGLKCLKVYCHTDSRRCSLVPAIQSQQEQTFERRISFLKNG